MFYRVRTWWLLYSHRKIFTGLHLLFPISNLYLPYWIEKPVHLLFKICNCTISFHFCLMFDVWWDFVKSSISFASFVTWEKHHSTWFEKHLLNHIYIFNLKFVTTSLNRETIWLFFFDNFKFRMVSFSLTSFSVLSAVIESSTPFAIYCRFTKEWFDAAFS